MADTQPTASRRELQLERMRKRHPEKKLEDDEEIFGTISDDYDEYEEREKALSDMFRADPRSAYFLNDMREGKDPVMGLVSRFGMEVRDVLDDPAMQEKIKEANQEYLDRVAKNRALEEEYDRNMDATLKALADYQARENLSDEEVDAICAAWLQIVRDGVMGKITAETIKLMSDAVNHDTDEEAAREEGLALGRNTKITEKLERRKQGDGIQNLNGRNGIAGGGGRERPKSIFDLAREAD